MASNVFAEELSEGLFQITWSESGLHQQQKEVTTSLSSGTTGAINCICSLKLSTTPSANQYNAYTGAHVQV